MPKSPLLQTSVRVFAWNVVGGGVFDCWKLNSPLCIPLTSSYLPSHCCKCLTTDPHLIPFNKRCWRGTPFPPFSTLGKVLPAALINFVQWNSSISFTSPHFLSLSLSLSLSLFCFALSTHIVVVYREFSISICHCLQHCFILHWYCLLACLLIVIMMPVNEGTKCVCVCVCLFAGVQNTFIE